MTQNTSVVGDIFPRVRDPVSRRYGSHLFVHVQQDENFEPYLRIICFECAV